MTTTPLQKLLQARGVGSKNEVRELISAGAVTVAGEVVTRFAEPVHPEARVTVDGQPLRLAEPAQVWLMNKPKKHITGLVDPDGRDTLAPYIPDTDVRLFAVGRLDFNTEGALLWTNDGLLSRRLLHPDSHVEKRYGIKIRGHLDNDDPGLERFRAGMSVGSERYRPAKTRVVAMRTRATWVEVTLTEGKFRQLRKMCRACGYQIVKLRRLAIGPIELGDLKPRCCRPVVGAELQALYDAAGLTLTTEGERAAP